MKMERGLTDLGIVFEAAPPEGVVSLADLGSAFLGVPTPSPAAQSKFNRIADAIAGGMRNFFATPGDFAAGRHAVAPANAGQITEEEAFRLNQAQDAMTNWGAQAALAMLGVGAPKAMIGAGGAAGGRLPGPRSLPMDEASRMARSREMGHAPEPFYRGERNGLLPRQYESAHFSRSKSVADGTRGWAAIPRRENFASTCAMRTRTTSR